MLVIHLRAALLSRFKEEGLPLSQRLQALCFSPDGEFFQQAPACLAPYAA